MKPNQAALIVSGIFYPMLLIALMLYFIGVVMWYRIRLIVERK